VPLIGWIIIGVVVIVVLLIIFIVTLVNVLKCTQAPSSTGTGTSGLSSGTTTGVKTAPD
jgi:hypothetical protein